MLSRPKLRVVRSLGWYAVRFEFFTCEACFFRLVGQTILEMRESYNLHDVSYTTPRGLGGRITYMIRLLLLDFKHTKKNITSTKI